MTYQTVPVNIVGGSNPTRSKSVSSERTLNLYPEFTPSGSYPTALYPWWGSENYSDGTGSGVARGIYTHERNGVVYKVAGTKLYSMASDGVETLIGTVAGSGPVDFASLYDNVGNIGTKLLIATNTTGYVYEIDDNILTEVTDPSYSAGGSVEAINSFAIWQIDGNQYAVGDVGNPASIQPENISTTISFADDLVRIIKFKETIYMFGTRSGEPYYIGTSDTNPLVSIQNSSITVGMIERGCADVNERALYWVGNDKILYRTTAYQQESVTPPAIAKQLFALNFANGRVACVKIDGQNFVLVLTGTKSFVYAETTNLWFELSYKAEEEAYLGYGYTYAYNKHFIQSRRDSRVLQLKEDVYTDNGEITIRERITAPITFDGGRFTAKRLELIMESGVGNLSEVDPDVMISHSVDGGQSFSNEVRVKVGRDGENNIRIEYYFMVSCRSLQFKIRSSDPNFFNFQSCNLDVKRGGKF